MIRNRIFTLLIIFCATFASADVTVKLQAPRQAIIGQRIRVSYVVNTQDVDDIQVGDFEGFNVLFGPSTSSQSSFSMVNGKTTQTSSITFTYMLEPAEEGTFTIPAATIVCGGKKYQSDTANIEILQGDADDNVSQGTNHQSQQSSSSQRQQTDGEESVNVGNGELFMNVSASKKKIYEQEAVLLTYKLYTLVNVQQIAGEMPELDGFHVQEIESKSQMSLKYERVNGRNYGTAVWRQYILYPQKTGSITVPAVTFDTQIEVQNKSMDPFDIFFGGGSLSQVVKKSITAPSLNIEVEPLPTPKPENFSGAVGKFSISGTLTPQQLNANDATTLRLVVSGQGNMKLMKAPAVNFPKDFEVYDPKQDDKTTNTSVGAKGNIVYDYVVVPRHGGKFQIPPVEFSYFDTDESKYMTLRTDSFQLDVAKAKGGSMAPAHEQEDLKILSDDIRYIKMGRVKMHKSDDTFFGSSSYWLIYLTLSIIFLVLLGIFHHQAKESANVSRQRGKKAGKAAGKRLKIAARLLREHNAGQFYDEVMRALFGYAGDKLNLPTAELTKDNVSEALSKKGVEVTLVNSFIDVLSQCEFARFAPGDPNATMDKIYAQATEVINKLDSQIHK